MADAKVEPSDLVMDSAVEATIEVVSVASPVRVIVDMIGNLSEGMIEAVEMAELPGSIGVIEAIDPLG